MILEFFKGSGILLLVMEQTLVSLFFPFTKELPINLNSLNSEPRIITQPEVETVESHTDKVGAINNKGDVVLVQVSEKAVEKSDSIEPCNEDCLITLPIPLPTVIFPEPPYNTNMPELDGKPTDLPPHPTELPNISVNPEPTLLPEPIAPSPCYNPCSEGYVRGREISCIMVEILCVE